MGRIIKLIPNTGKLPEIGKIKIGDKKVNQNGKEYPVSLDYFRATGDYSKMFHDTYGDKCNKLPIIFASDNIDAVCNEEYVIRDKAGRLIATGDGKNWKVFDAKDESYKPKEMSESEAGKLGIMKIILTLRFLLLDIKVFGQWRLETAGAASSVPQIRDTFDFVLNAAGTIVNVPFDLVVKKVKSQKPGVASSYPVIQLIPNLSPEHLEKLYALKGAGAEMRGVLSGDRIDQLSLPSATLGLTHITPDDAYTKDEIDEGYADYEDVSALDAACEKMLESKTLVAATEVWKSNKEFWNEEKFINAKNEIKQKLK